MPTLNERMTESIESHETRIAQRQEALDVSPALSRYIEMLEKYLLELEERVMTMERKMKEDYYPIHIITN